MPLPTLVPTVTGILAEHASLPGMILGERLRDLLAPHLGDGLDLLRGSAVEPLIPVSILNHPKIAVNPGVQARLARLVRIRTRTPKRAVQVSARLQKASWHGAPLLRGLEVHTVLPPSPNDVPLAQDYHQTSPRGIGLASTRGVKHDDIRLVDVEYAWDARKGGETLPMPPRLWGETEWLVNDAIPQVDVIHGTLTLGVLAMSEPAPVGICPAATILRASTIERVTKRDGQYAFTNNPPAAMLAAALALEPGDVLLLEAQAFSASDPGQLVPAEFSPVIHVVVSCLTELGIIVVAPAGNGGADLDQLKPASDSGSVLVAAAEVFEGGWRRAASSNFGSRIVHCFGPGTDVLSVDPGNIAGYSRNYSGTSSAAAIVAGVAALVSSAYKAKHGKPIKPHPLRSLLSDGQNTRADKPGIGVLPNLEWLMRNL